MQVESYFQFMNPLVFLLFSAGLFCINAIRPSRAVLLLAIAYLFGATGFTVDILDVAGLRTIGVIPVSGVYAMTAVLTSGALTLRFCGKAPWPLYAAAFAGHMTLYSWIYLTFGAGWASSIVANFGCGAIFAIGLFFIRNHVTRKIDKVVFWLGVIGALQCFARPLLIGYLTGGMTTETFDLPLFLMVLHFVVGACAVVLGMALLVSFSSEIVSDLEQRSVTDRLSGILNRRGFEEAAETVLRTRRDYAFTSVILADIDHFKRVNDTRGHTFGDMVIAEFGALFSEYADQGRIAGRIGGEEFAMLITGEPLHAGKDLAEALRRDFGELRIAVSEEESAAGFTASFGVAQRQPGEELLSVIARADEALYLSKANGRNRVSCETDVQVDKLRSLAGAHDRRKHRDNRLTAQAG